MDVSDKLQILGLAAEYDVCGRGCSPRGNASPLRFIEPVSVPGRGVTYLFKVLQTNACVNDCVYCVNQLGRDSRRLSFQPEELARLFMDLHRKRLVQGLFLSSAIAGKPTPSMERMVQTVEILRERYHFPGYVHLKIMPGASQDVIEAGCRLANRVSVNMEAPTAEHLAKLTSKKDIYRGILEPMRFVKRLKAGNEKLVPSGQTTQFVVGAAGETDGDILHSIVDLYREVDLKRAYFSAFRPVSGSRLEGVPPTPAIREHRLYQADWLLRVYHFSPREIELALGGNGNLGCDPKLAIASKQPWLFPVDVNRASYDELLRVPGIGPISAQKILDSRSEHSIFSLDQLRKMRVSQKAAGPFIWFQGMTSIEKALSRQLPLEDVDPVCLLDTSAA